MVLKTAPETSGQHLTQAIGDPREYTTNCENNSFPESYDLRIPQASGQRSSVGAIGEADIAGALSAINVNRNSNGAPFEERKGPERRVGSMNNNGAKNFQQANDYNRRSSEHAPDQYMPIKALN